MLNRTSFIKARLSPLQQSYRALSSLGPKGAVEHTHFRASGIPHPLHAKPKEYFTSQPKDVVDAQMGDHTGRQQNHIWTTTEIDFIRKNMYRHIPTTAIDKGVNTVMYSLYHIFNFISGYREKNPTTSAIEWRLIVLVRPNWLDHHTMLSHTTNLSLSPTPPFDLLGEHRWRSRLCRCRFSPFQEPAHPAARSRLDPHAPRGGGERAHAPARVS